MIINHSTFHHHLTVRILIPVVPAIMSQPQQAKYKYLDVQTAAVVTSSSAGEPESEHHHHAKPLAVESMSMEVESAFVKGTVQEPAFRDKWFGIAFLAHFGVVIAVATLYATGTLQVMETEALEGDGSINDPNRRFLQGLSNSLRLLQNGETTDTTASSSETEEDEGEEALSEEGAIRLVATFLLSVCTAPMLALLAMKYMTTHAVQLIQYSLYFAIALNAALGVAFFALVSPVAGVWNLLLAAILACYARAIWHRIPFAAANLKAAVTCVQSNLGMVALSLASIPLFTLWFVMWAYVFACVMNSPWMKSQEQEIQATDDTLYGHSNVHEQETLTTPGFLVIASLLLSFYWTWHVLRNVVHTTLAGTVGTWWFLPQEANGCCSRGLRDSLSRSLTYSFGSICLGSLIVAIVEVLKSMLRSAARNQRGGILRLIAQCLLIWIERIAEYFNKWAFVYVGLYGYSYVEAGKNVFNLFRHRGWSTIISDSLIHRMLGMMCLCIALVNALAAAIWTLGSSDSDVMWVSAFFAFFMGLLMSSMTFGVLVSAVDSIIVLWAEAPAEFKDNHPHLCQELEDTWAQAWPDVFSPSGRGAPVVATPVV